MIKKLTACTIMCVTGHVLAQESLTLRELKTESGVVVRYLACEPAQLEGAAIFVGLPPGDQTEKLGRVAFDTYWKNLPESGWVVLVPIAEAGVRLDGDSSTLDAFFDALPKLYGPSGSRPHLGGISSGGNSAYRMAIRRTAGRLSSLVLMPGGAVNAEELKSADACKELEVRIVAGADDDESWKTATRATHRALFESGARVKLIVRENEGHMLRITPAEFRNMMDELKASAAPAPGAVLAQEAAAGAVLDDFHLAASQADGPRYFGHFAPGGVFLGTDATERWSVEEFRAYAEPYFSQGKGWTYVVKSRHVTISEDGRYAWFDETLENEKYGSCRGSGVLVKIGGEWKVAQYNLTVPIPNEMLADVAREIRARQAEK